MLVPQSDENKLSEDRKRLKALSPAARLWLDSSGMLRREDDDFKRDPDELPAIIEALADEGQRIEHFLSAVAPHLSVRSAPQRMTGRRPEVIATFVPNEPPALAANGQSLEFRVPSADETASLLSWDGWETKAFATDEVLCQFLAIHDTQDALAFATAYGPLWTCAAHPPRVTSESPCVADYAAHTDARGATHRWENPEPTSWWIQAAGALRSVVTAADLLDRGEHLSPDVLTGLGVDPVEFRLAVEGLSLAFAEDPDPIALARVAVAHNIETHLDKYGVTLAVNAKWDVGLRSSTGILPALWLRALDRIVGGLVTVCHGCQGPYIRRKRAAPRTQSNWCPTCKENGLDKRASARRRRA